MPAYLIVTREEPVHDTEAFTQYQTLTRQVQTPIKLTPRVVYGAMESLEGDAPDGVVILEFDCMQDAHDWYHSGDYQKALPHRLRAAKHRAFIVDGMGS